MIQDIAPQRLDNQYQNRTPQAEDVLISFQEGNVLLSRSELALGLPTLREYSATKSLRFLFAVDGRGYYLVLGMPLAEQGSYRYEPVRGVRQVVSKDVCFFVMTAWHLYVWYRDNQFCGRCGGPVTHDEKLRMLRCPACGNLIFPKVAPAVIVCITDGDRILMTKYADRDYTKYALVAGFIEIGETAEETVAREVMEEVGLRVKNIRYYKSQPWGVDSNLLLGYFCELDGEDSITMDDEELAAARWFHRKDMPAHDDGISLTRDMMRVFEEQENF